jgi:muramoyltetrapeptide carboxypeptidase
MLTQLLNSGGIKSHCHGSQFTEFGLCHTTGATSCKRRWLQKALKKPVLTNLPYGHVATSPAAGRAKIDMAEGRDVLMVWGHL